MSGTTSMWPRLTGRMSMNATQRSSRCTKLAGALPATISQKTQAMLTLRVLFGVAGVAMARRRQVRVPAARGAEDELDAAGVARRNRALEVALAERDRLAAHRAN